MAVGLAVLVYERMQAETRRHGNMQRLQMVVDDGFYGQPESYPSPMKHPRFDVRLPGFCERVDLVKDGVERLQQDELRVVSVTQPRPQSTHTPHMSTTTNKAIADLKVGMMDCAVRPYFYREWCRVR